MNKTTSLKDIEIMNFYTDVFKSSFLSKGFKPSSDFSVVKKNKNAMFMYDNQKLHRYLNEYKITVFSQTREQVDRFKRRNIKHTVGKNKISVLEFNNDFFELKGKKHKKIRRYRNMYTNTCKIDVRDEPNSIEEVIEFIEKWKIIRKDAYFQLFAGYDMNFFREYYYRFRDRLIPFYFYYEGVLVGYNIIERVDKNKYNLLLRKVNTNYTNLCLFVDYYAMEKIFRNINEPIFLNMEGDVGSKGLLNYKTQSFHVPIRVFEMYDIRIPKTIGTLL